jgi:hypothetical protein
MPSRLPAKVFPLPFGDLRLDLNAIEQSIRVWVNQGDRSMPAILIRLQQADPVLCRAVLACPEIEHWLANMLDRILP